jgi:hypothetical protein
MWMRLTLLALAAAPQMASAGSPIAEVICAPRDEMVARLTRQMGSTMAASGIRDAEAVIEVWTAPSGDWTLVQTYTDGRSCILAMGAAWDMPPPAKAG